MFSRSLLAARNAVKARAPRRSMGYVTDYKPPSMADLPVPQGSWQDAYSAKQRTYNLQLLAGVVTLGGTMGYLVQSDALNFCWGPKIGK
ncbi:uncharacterized protein LOC127004175 [Eriocheir sinensis]|uniref:uncharacterized protein LOC127004175 n=1 Tax=Eriocheir sinensis TaxID=95602 RepID=UPI0021C7674A|nr:uncharacterized protein LOC127004175 [Eriocheir sinensis]